MLSRQIKCKILYSYVDELNSCPIVFMHCTKARLRKETTMKEKVLYCSICTQYKPRINQSMVFYVSEEYLALEGRGSD